MRDQASLPDLTRARKEVRRMTGESFVPVLVTDSEEVVAGSHRIEAWAMENPATAASPSV